MICCFSESGILFNLLFNPCKCPATTPFYREQTSLMYVLLTLTIKIQKRNLFKLPKSDIVALSTRTTSNLVPTSCNLVSVLNIQFVKRADYLAIIMAMAQELSHSEYNIDLSIYLETKFHQ